ARIRTRAAEGSATSAMVTSIRPLRSRRLPRDHHLLDLRDRLGGVQPLGAGLGAVHDRVAAVELERILEVVEPLRRRLVAAVDEPAIGLQQDGGTEIFLAVPPIG